MKKPYNQEAKDLGIAQYANYLKEIGMLDVYLIAGYNYLCMHDRRPDIVIERFMFVYYLYNVAGHDTVSTATIVGGRDHSTVIHTLNELDKVFYLVANNLSAGRFWNQGYIKILKRLEEGKIEHCRKGQSNKTKAIMRWNVHVERLNCFVEDMIEHKVDPMLALAYKLGAGLDYSLTPTPTDENT